MLCKEEISDWLKALQGRICLALEQADGAGKFSIEEWERSEGGGGITRILQNGKVIEKGGVNFSAVSGKLPENISNALQLPPSDFFATGVSIVIHPHNPHVPIIHMNVRYFETMPNTINDKPSYWFGGGIDLTPHYIVNDDARFFHMALKTTCDKFDADYYPKFKKWADDYFFITHRNETRGVGGIFFDRLSDSEKHTKESRFEFLKAVGETFAPVYTELIKHNHKKPFTEKEKQWQLIRRGRYVEFNLVYDKGTKFGLDTNGRIESILMSLPALASWQYNHTPEPGSAEEKTTSLLKKGVEWA
ncbi:MAG: Oxygen-dependent coproporphyrinogen-III oxidase [Bacteroidia bacterium]|nr:Oxygen-dependent coproporphyrinogen-III oxidase [Bacteroidia bacterium]